MVLLRATRIALRPLIPLIPLIVVSLGMTSVACKEEQGGVEVKDLSFTRKQRCFHQATAVSDFDHREPEGSVGTAGVLQP